MPNMTDDNPPRSGVLDPDDFDRAASRGFVRYELAVTRSELKQDIAHVRLEIAEAKRELQQGLADLRTELKRDIADLRTEPKQDNADIRHEIATLRTDMIERFNALDRSMWWKLSVAVVAASALAELFGRL